MEGMIANFADPVSNLGSFYPLFQTALPPAPPKGTGGSAQHGVHTPVIGPSTEDERVAERLYFEFVDVALNCKSGDDFQKYFTRNAPKIKRLIDALGACADPSEALDGNTVDTIDFEPLLDAAVQAALDDESARVEIDYCAHTFLRALDTVAAFACAPRDRDADSLHCTTFTAASVVHYFGMMAIVRAAGRREEGRPADPEVVDRAFQFARNGAQQAFVAARHGLILRAPSEPNIPSLAEDSSPDL